MAAICRIASSVLADCFPVLESRLVRTSVAHGSNLKNQPQGLIEESPVANSDAYLDNYNPGLNTRNACKLSTVQVSRFEDFNLARRKFATDRDNAFDEKG